jgi:hypothetical protein
MNSIKPNKLQYLIGTWEEGEFWCRGEYSSEEAARANYELLCKFHPDKHIELVQQVTTHSGLEYHRPKNDYVYEL